jgi:hypothetical protein
VYEIQEQALTRSEAVPGAKSCKSFANLEPVLKGNYHEYRAKLKYEQTTLPDRYE